MSGAILEVIVRRAEILVRVFDPTTVRLAVLIAGVVVVVCVAIRRK